MGVYYDDNGKRIFRKENVNTKVFDDGKVVGIRHNYSGIVFYISKEDENLVSKYNWYYDKSVNYIRSGYNSTHNKTYHIDIHKLIMSQFYDLTGKVVDHIDRNTLNNTRENLRVISKRGNAINSNKFDNKLIGFRFDKSRYLYTAVIIIDNKLNYLGSYSNKYYAALKYDYFIIHNFPEDIPFTNFYRGLYPQDILDEFNITNINDIPDLPSNYGIIYNYWGIKPIDDNFSAHVCNDIIGVYKTELEAVAARENYIENNDIIATNPKIHSNVFYPKAKNDLKIICGEIKTKQERYGK